MGRSSTKPLSGGGKDKFLRGVVASVDGVSDAARRALSQALADGIAEVRVRRESYDRIRTAGNGVEERAPKAVAPASQPVGPGVSVAQDGAADATPSAAGSPAAAAAATFDPFAFSVVAILTRKGRAALLIELAQVTAAADLRRLAEAQHLALDPALADPGEIRMAIVAGAERRIAERKAAAS